MSVDCSPQLIDAIQKGVKTETITVDGQSYVTRQIFARPADPIPNAINVRTLASIVDFLAANIDKLDVAKLVISIEDPETVSIVGEIKGWPPQRITYVVAHHESVLRGFRFETYMNPEDFNIALQTLFKPEGNRAAILKVVGTLKDEKVTTVDDDGTSQTVTAKAGIARVAEVQVPNPITLYPYRTFREVDQPGSPFVLRMKKGNEGQLPTCALYEADGGLWKLDAIANIKGFLEEGLEKAGLEVPIIA